MPNPATAQNPIVRYCEAFQRRDVEAIALLLAPDAVMELPLFDAAVAGRDAIVGALRTAIRGLKNIKIIVEHIAEAGEGALAEGMFHADQVGVPPWVDGTPARLDFRFVAAATMQAGKIARWTEYFDTKPLKPRERTHLYPISRRSAYFEGTARAGVSEFMVYNHMYMPLVYHHSPAEEYAALTERVTLWDVGGERQTEIRGKDALRFAQWLTSRDLSKIMVGDCKYTLACDLDGRILCDPVLLYPFDQVVWLSHGDVDLTLWAQGLRHDSGFEVQISEPDIEPLQVQGPKSLEMLRPWVDAPLDQLGFYKCVATRVHGIDAVVSRTGWSGGLGFEIFPLSSASAMRLWDALLDAGRPFGLTVTGPNVMRAVERGVTDTAYYSGSAMNPFEAGHGRLVDLGKGDFVGRKALQRIAAEGVKRKTVGLLIDGDLPTLEWYWPLKDARGNPGEVRWAVHSFALDRSIGIAIADASLALGEVVEISHQRGTTRATVTDIPFV
jgi:aminomethyltransferase